MNTKTTFFATPECITDQADVVANMDMILITTPSFALKHTLDEIISYCKRSTPIGVIPGTGGVEFIAKKLIENDFTIFGTDRVPCIARVTTYGKQVSAEKKSSVRLCAFPQTKTLSLCRMIADLWGLECTPLENYLTVTLTPSNPILHTTRLYALYQKAAPSHTWESNIPFYEDWDDLSSEMLIACDQELQNLCKSIEGLNLSSVIPLTNHYESYSTEAMTRKISGIAAFKNIPSPMIIKDGQYILDLKSRYFTEDFPYGLCIIKGFAEIFSCNTPQIDKVLKWYQHISGHVYFTNTGFNGKDLRYTAIPQNFGIQTETDVYNRYCKQ